MSVWKKVASAAGGEPEGAWDLSYAYYDPPASLAWDVSTMYKTPKVFSVAAQESTPQGLFFKPDGTKMYVIGNSQTVTEYNLSTAWDVSSASYLQSFSVSAQETQPTGLFFKPDGTKMYVIGLTGYDVNEYDLSTAWDVSSASYQQNFSVAAQETQPSGIFFKPDGTKMYVIGYVGDDVNEYDLSTAWDVSSASYLQNFSVAAQETLPTDVSFKPDGTKMYVLGFAGADMNEYSLSTPWDISSASYVQNRFIGNSPAGFFFKPDGGAFYAVDFGYDTVEQWTLGGFSVFAQESSPTGIFFKPDGTKMYVIGLVGDKVNEYDLSTAWDLSSASYLQNFSVAAQELNPTGVFFKPDGTKMYVIGLSGDDVNEYDLSTPWDVTSASYQTSFSVVYQDNSPEGVFFSPDGANMYIIGVQWKRVTQYYPTTAWDVSTASRFSFDEFSVSAQELDPTGLFFKPDGTKMYVVGTTGDDVNEYDLSTPWDVTSASYLQNFNVEVQAPSVEDVFFKDDGTQMFILDLTDRRVYSYTLGPQ